MIIKNRGERSILVMESYLYKRATDGLELVEDEDENKKAEGRIRPKKGRFRYS